MKTIAKKMLPVIFTLLSSACVHYPAHYGYYSGDSGYSRGYTIMHRNHYGERPEHYFPHPQRHNQYNAMPRYGYENSRRYDDSGSRRNNFGGRYRY